MAKRRARKRAVENSKNESRTRYERFIDSSDENGRRGQSEFGQVREGSSGIENVAVSRFVFFPY